VNRVVANGRTRFEPVDGSSFEQPVDLVLLAMGFTGAAPGPLLTDLSLRMTERGTVWRDDHWMTSVPSVFTAGDMQRGQSLIVWAIADGRQGAESIDRFVLRSPVGQVR
jgi:glutamate synthase (NADPH/NADH) small chain